MRVADHVVRRRLEGEDREVTGCDLALEIGYPEAPYRRREDHDLAEHHEEDRENEEARRKAAQNRRERDPLHGGHYSMTDRRPHRRNHEIRFTAAHERVTRIVPGRGSRGRR